MNEAGAGFWPTSKYNGGLAGRAADSPAWTGRASTLKASPTRAGSGFFFAIRIILERTLPADAELEPAGVAIIPVVVNGETIFQPQRAEFGDVDVQAQAPVIVKILSGGRIRLFIDGSHVVEQT